MSYKKLDIQEFGHHLLKTNDLDPVYVALFNLLQESWPEDQIKRWLVAYWCFYNCGFASYVSELEGSYYWDEMLKAAKNEVESPVGGRWPRGAERRHFRGKNGISSVEDLKGRYQKPEQMVDFIVGKPDERSFKQVCARVRVHKGFGPWIGFKVCDMIDRVLGVKIDFNQAAIFMFKDPVQAVIMLWREVTGYGPTAKPKDLTQVINQVVTKLKDDFKEYKAPPSYDRLVDLQEVETVLCKWKSHMNGHYPLLKDSKEITEGLSSWARFTSADEFKRAMPNIV